MNNLVKKLMEKTFNDITLRDAITTVCMNTPNPEYAFEVIFNVHIRDCLSVPPHATIERYPSIDWDTLLFNPWLNTVSFIYQEEIVVYLSFKKEVKKSDLTSENYKDYVEENTGNYIHAPTGNFKTSTATLSEESFLSQLKY